MLSHFRLFATPWTVAHQAPLSMEFSRQGYWSGLPFPPPGDLPDPGIKPESLAFPALAGGFFTTEQPGKLWYYIIQPFLFCVFCLLWAGKLWMWYSFPRAAVMNYHKPGGLKTTEIYCLTILEVRSPKSRCQQDHTPSGSSVRKSIPCLS